MRFGILTLIIMTILMIFIFSCDNRDDQDISTEFEWTYYTSTNIPTLPSFWGLYTIAVDNIGDVWAGGGQGLFRLHDEEWSFINSENSALPSGQVRQIEVDKDNNKWLIVGNRYFIQINGIDNQIYDYSPSIVNSIHSFSISINGDIWFSTGYGLLRKYGTYWSLLSNDNSDIPIEELNLIQCDKNGNVWFTAQPDREDSGIYKYDGYVFTNYNVQNSGILSNEIEALWCDNDNIVWLGCMGLTSYNGQEWHNYSTYNSNYPGNIVTYIKTDKYKMPWFISVNETKLDEVYLVGKNGSEFTIYNNLNSPLLNDNSTRFSFDDKGNIWLVSSDRIIHGVRSKKSIQKSESKFRDMVIN